jgi:serine/threonine protein phosphatase 1
MANQSLDRLAGPHEGIRLPKHVRIYAIGDIHGRLDLLDQLHERIKDDLRSAAEKQIKLVYLGDYVDRGPNSSGVVSRLLEPEPFPAERIFLRGNHEEILLNFIDGRAYRERWFLNGGAAAIKAYGIDTPDHPTETEAWAIAAKLSKRLPATHRAFFDDLMLMHRVGDVVFVHAGINPDRSLENQRAEDLLWIREKFLNTPHNLGALIVHGHTPESEPSITPYRIGIDTLAWQSGHLTAAVLEHGHVRFLST